MTIWEKFINNVRLRRAVVLALIVGVLFALRGLMNTILLTFIFTFLVVRLINFIQKKVKIPSLLIVIVVYALILFGVYFVVIKYAPKIFNQFEGMVKSVITFYQNPPKGANDVVSYISDYISKSDITAQVKNGAAILFQSITTLGSFGVSVFMALLLSFFFTIEKDRMFSFSRNFLTGPYSWFFKDIRYFANIFVNTFGVVLEAQFFIAIANTVLTLIGLSLMKIPQLDSLVVMIFILSMIPVAGVIISAIPMSLIAYTDGGVKAVVYVLLMILMIHALESYVLNPKLMSSKTNLPIFYTFVVLFVSEHIFGTWGLIVGIPIFIFLLEVLGVHSVGNEKKTKKKRVKKERRVSE
ncbi:AI-2E family transporter [Ligilactobacillus acidipiscis]|uniref:AI-2E family transporter n=1 Tax=Ligilactobacillus acidipiscis TaxID=89059 RepID=UPI0023F86375|nr:AI-2E family transporter [Ligilactobacillus acidipiscis]WEV57511.1 AI-2E family transporter [Ligilactobacillus acidipiscis]